MKSLRQAPFSVVWVVVLVGLVLIATEYWRRGLTVVGSAAVLAGLLRLLLPTHRAGWLVVRGRTVDVVGYVAAGLSLALIAFSVPAT
ncbi:MAG: DUF3017 domain-containing protein [Geodermatophilaceae bacterium]|nr:DUF3017 domain-containing protein [Geodermatophilaceae bacterium]